MLKRLSRGGLALLLSLSVLVPFNVHAASVTDIQTVVDYAILNDYFDWYIDFEFYTVGGNESYDYDSSKIAVDSPGKSSFYSLYYKVNASSSKYSVYYFPIEIIPGVASSLVNGKLTSYQLIAYPDRPALNGMKPALSSHYTVTTKEQYDVLVDFMPSLDSMSAYMLFDNPENSSTLLKVYPHTGWLKGSFFSSSGWNKKNQISVSDRYSQYLIFYSDVRIASLDLYDSSGNLAYSFGYQYRYLRGDVYYHIFKIDIVKTDYFDFYFVPTSDGLPTELLPVYWGFDIAMTDDMRVHAFLPSTTDALISDGTTESQGQVGQLVEKNDSLNTVINDYDSMEKGFQDNVSSSLSAINPGSSVEWTADILSTFSFVSSKVTDIYNGMGSFKVLIMFSLVLGLALLLIGVDAKK